MWLGIFEGFNHHRGGLSIIHRSSFAESLPDQLANKKVKSPDLRAEKWNAPASDRSCSKNPSFLQISLCIEIRDHIPTWSICDGDRPKSFFRKRQIRSWPEKYPSAPELNRRLASTARINLCNTLLIGAKHFSVYKNGEFPFLYLFSIIYPACWPDRSHFASPAICL